MERTPCSHVAAGDTNATELTVPVARPRIAAIVTAQ
jgi:hypothetical protein